MTQHNVALPQLDNDEIDLRQVAAPLVVTANHWRHTVLPFPEWHLRLHPQTGLGRSFQIVLKIKTLRRRTFGAVGRSQSNAGGAGWRQWWRSS